MTDIADVDMVALIELGDDIHYRLKMLEIGAATEKNVMIGCLDQLIHLQPRVLFEALRTLARALPRNAGTSTCHRIGK